MNLCLHGKNTINVKSGIATKKTVFNTISDLLIPKTRKNSTVTPFLNLIFNYHTKKNNLGNFENISLANLCCIQPP